MLRFGLFKQVKPRQFNLQYRYYDERKERLDKLRKKLNATTGDEEFDPKFYREHLRSSWSTKRVASKSGNGGMRVVIIFVILAGLIYWIFV